MIPEPVFEEPWHAQVFALTVHLNEAGHFAWSEWASRFGAILAKHGLSKDLNGGSDYFMAWVDTLESFLSEKKLVDADSLAALKSAWEQAYACTPHGQPVVLSN